MSAIRKRNKDGTKAGEVMAYIWAHPNVTTGEIARAIDWPVTRVSATVYAELGRPRPTIERIEIPPRGHGRMPQFAYRWRTGHAVQLEAEETTQPVTAESPDERVIRPAEDVRVEAAEPVEMQQERAETIEALLERNMPGKVQYQEPVSDVMHSIDALARAIAQQVAQRVQTYLVDQLAKIAPVSAQAAPLTLEELAARILPAEQSGAKSRRATVLVAGLLPNQAGIIQSEFRDVFDLRFFMVGDSLKHLTDMIKHVDHIVTFTSKIPHTVEETIKNAGRPLHRCSGGMTMLRDQLTKLYVEGK